MQWIRRHYRVSLFLNLARIGKAAMRIPAPRRHKTLLDKPIPLIDVPILKPIAYQENKISSLKSLAKSATQSVNQKLNEFANWILSYIPEEIKKPVDNKLKSFKERVNEIFNNIDKFTSKERKSAFKGYFKTYRIDGVKGYDFKEFF